MIANGKSISDIETDIEWNDVNYRLVNLGMVEITASPEELRNLASFLQSCADKGDKFDHYHYQDRVGVYPDFVIMVET